MQDAFLLLSSVACSTQCCHFVSCAECQAGAGKVCSACEHDWCQAGCVRPIVGSAGDCALMTQF